METNTTTPPGSSVRTGQACYLRVGDDPVEQAVRMKTKAAAIAAFKSTAQNLAQYGQSLDGFIHLAESQDDLVDYPDFVLSLGPRGGVHCERA